MAWFLKFSSVDSDISTTMDGSQNSQDALSFNNSESGEHQSNNIDEEASILRSEVLEDSCNYVSDSGPCEGYSGPSTSQKLQPTVRNRRCLPESAKTYQLDKFSENLMLVFNMNQIPTYEPRYGTDNDVSALKSCFEPRGFNVIVYPDYTKDQIYSVFDNLILEDLSDIGSLAVVFLTHGRDGGILLTADHPIHEGAIIEFLTGKNAPSLITKPKILIFQACRGTKVSQPARTGDEILTTSYSHDGDYKSDKPYGMANETDFLRIHSAYPGMVSHRGTNEGSWFIQSLCKFVGASNPDDDILSIIPLVIHDVSINKENEIRNQNNDLLAVNKQVPIMTTTLSRKLCFNTKRVLPNLVESESSDDVDSSITQTDVVGNETNSDVVKKIMEVRNNIQRRALSKPSLSDIVLNQKYNTYDFRFKYFEYVRDLLDYFVETSGPNYPNAQQIRPVLDIAKTIDCSLSFSKTREQTCLQMIMFLEEQNFDGKESVFFYKYL